MRRGQGSALPVELWTLVAANFVIAVGYGLVAPVLPGYAKSFGVSVAQAAAVISAFAVMRLVFAPLAGKLVSHYGERGIYFWGLVIVAASSAGCALAHSYWQLLLLRAVGGIGSTMFSVSGVGLLMRLTPAGSRGRASSLWSTAFLVGAVAGPLLGAVLVAVSVQLPFLGYAALLVVVAAGTGVALHKSTLAVRVDRSRPVMTLREAMAHPTYRAALVSSFADGWAMVGMRVALLPLFLTTVLGATDHEVGPVLAVFAATNAALVFVSGRLADTLGRRPMVLTGLVIAAVATAGMGLFSTVEMAIAMSALAGIGAGLFTPAQTAAVADVLGGRHGGGPVLATYQMATDCGTIAGPLIAGVLAEAVSFEFSFILGAVLVLIAALWWLPAKETSPTKLVDRYDEKPTDTCAPSA